MTFVAGVSVVVFVAVRAALTVSDIRYCNVGGTNEISVEESSIETIPSYLFLCDGNKKGKMTKSAKSLRFDETVMKGYFENDVDGGRR
jgi:hypothetical protein